MLEAVVEIWQLKKLVQTLVNLGQSKKILDVDEPWLEKRKPWQCRFFGQIPQVGLLAMIPSIN
jgi:hypothetical protein